MSYAPAYPHDPIEQIASDLFMVRGCIPMNRFMRITRNMAIVRHGDELSLVNPMRLSDEGEKKLRALGSVKRVLRLGPFHGLDDRYYVDSFGAKMWAPGVSRTYPEPRIDRLLQPDTELPFPDAGLFCFEGTKQPEVVLLVRRDGGVLLTCDAIQHYGDYRHNSLLARIVMPFRGFPKTTIVGPIWLKIMTADPATLRRDFRRLLDLEFDHLLSAHGSFLRSGAHEAVRVAVDRAL